MISKGRSFYEEMQNCSALDLRDNRGKTHDLAFILLGVLLGILRRRDGTLSSIHRSMVNTNVALCYFLYIPEQPVVSRSHLPIVLQKVDVEVFDYLLFTHYGFRLSVEQKQWFSGDGKELRGSIEPGKKRGQAVVHLVNHCSGEVVAQNYYDGDKESEKPTLRNLLVESNIASQKITLDALHLCPQTTETIAEAGGVFLIGLKANQPKLHSKMITYANELPPLHQKMTLDFKHGRIEQRKYWLYDIKEQCFQQRWHKTAFSRLVKVQRTRINQKDGKASQEVSYYLSNQADFGASKDEIFDAVRNGTIDCGVSAPYYWISKHKAIPFFSTVPGGMTGIEKFSWINKFTEFFVWNLIVYGK